MRETFITPPMLPLSTYFTRDHQSQIPPPIVRWHLNFRSTTFSQTFLFPLRQNQLLPPPPPPPVYASPFIGYPHSEDTTCDLHSLPSRPISLPVRFFALACSLIMCWCFSRTFGSLQIERPSHTATVAVFPSKNRTPTDIGCIGPLHKGPYSRSHYTLNKSFKRLGTSTPPCGRAWEKFDPPRTGPLSKLPFRALHSPPIPAAPEFSDFIMRSFRGGCPRRTTSPPCPTVSGSFMVGVATAYRDFHFLPAFFSLPLTRNLEFSL